MKLSAPGTLAFCISLALAALAIAGVFVEIQYVTKYAFWVAIAAYVVLALSSLMKE